MEMGELGNGASVRDAVRGRLRAESASQRPNRAETWMWGRAGRGCGMGAAIRLVLFLCQDDSVQWL